MKTKALFNPRSIIFTLLFVCCFVIDVSAQTQDPKPFRRYQPQFVAQSDTINIENKDYLFLKSPMFFFPSYINLFKGHEVLIIIDGPAEKGYSVNFVVKDSILYLKRVTQRTTFGEYSTNKNDTAQATKGGAHLIKVSEKEIKTRVEKMTGGKFDKKGLLKANWVSGEFTVGADVEYKSGFIHAGTFAAKTLYKCVFEKGVLRKRTISEN